MRKKQKRDKQYSARQTAYETTKQRLDNTPGMTSKGYKRPGPRNPKRIGG